VPVSSSRRRNPSPVPVVPWVERWPMTWPKRCPCVGQRLVPGAGWPGCLGQSCHVLGAAETDNGAGAAAAVQALGGGLHGPVGVVERPAADNRLAGTG
jgi:hypothetical protein